MAQPDNQRIASGNSVLSQLRLSRVQTPTSSDQTLHLPKHSPKSNQHSESQFKDVKPRKKHGGGFDLDITVEDIIKSKDISGSLPIEKSITPSENKSNISKEEIKKASELTNLFLDTRNTLRADCNIIDPVTNIDIPSSPEIKTGPVGKYSRNTIVRAEKVKTMIGMKYLYIQRIYEWNEAHAGTNEHPGVEGVYNPLQILRNRKIRAKYKEFPKPLASKTIPLACIVFSKHNQTYRKRPWRMVWAIELNEFVSDSRWRARHWHELETPKGELWFPENEAPVETKSKRKNLKKRLHDKLFLDTGSEEKRHGRSSSVITSTSSDSEINMLKVTRSKSPKKGLRNKMKKFYQSSVGESSSSANVADIEDDRISDNPITHDTLNNQIFKRTIHSESSSDLVGKIEQTILSPPIIKIDPLDSDIGIQDVEFVPTKRSSVAVEVKDVSSDEEETSSKSEISQESCSDIDQEFSKIMTNVNYLYQVASLRTNHLLVIYPNHLQLLENKLKYITNQQTFEILQQMSNINDEELPVYEELYVGFLEEIKSIIHMVNDNYSVKIDTLLSNSDRAISEINASLSLELRKVNERLDNLDENFITIGPSDLTIKEGTNYKIMYFCLENLIVILLRFIWVMVNIFKGGAMIVGVLWKIIKFFFI